MKSKTAIRARHAVSIAILLVLIVAANARADDATSPPLTPEQQRQADALDADTLLVNKETALLNAQTALRNAKVASEVPTTGAGVTPPSGTVTGANNLTFAMYIASIDSLKAIAQSVCNDLKANSLDSVYVTSRNVAEVVAKDEALQKYRDILARRLDSATAEAKRLTEIVRGNQRPMISPAALAEVAAAIDVANGLIKGVAGIAAFFKTERKIDAQDNLLGPNEIGDVLALCKPAPPQPPATLPNYGPPTIVDADSDLLTLKAKIDVINNETTNISNKLNTLHSALNDLADARASLEAQIAEAAAAKDTKKQKTLKDRLPAAVADFQERASELSTSAQQFLDAVYKVDSSTGLSPLIVAAQFRALRDFATDNSGHRLILTPLKSSGYSLTTKRLLFDDKVAFAGGVALRVSVMQPDGKAAYERIFFRQSGWIRAEFNTDGELPKQNF